MPSSDQGLESVCCPMCGEDAATLLYRVRDHLFGQPDQFNLVRCDRCELVYLNPRPTPAALGRFYPDTYFCYQPLLRSVPLNGNQLGFSARTLAWQRIRQLERYVGRVPRAANILDVGCGANAFLYQLNKMRGCDTLGVDFNASVAEAICERLHMPALHGSLLDQKLESASFDGAAMYEYLEHEGQPLDVLRETRRLTKPGGWLVIETPDISSGLAKLFGRKWAQCDTPRHLVLYDRPTIARMLEQCGYKVIALRPLVNQWMLGFNILVALGFRNLGRLRPWEVVLGVAATLPFWPLPWIFPEFMRVYARAVE